MCDFIDVQKYPDDQFADKWGDVLSNFKLRTDQQVNLLIRVIIARRVQTALYLVEKGADPLMKYGNNELPLIMACEKGLTTVVDAMKAKLGDKITAEIEQKMVVLPKAQN